MIQAHDNANCDWQWDKLSGQLMDLVSGELKVETAESAKGITLFKSVGAASFDAAVALKIAQAAHRDQIGQSVAL